MFATPRCIGLARYSDGAMATIEDRWWRLDPSTGARVATDLHGRGKRWRVRYRDPAGKNRAPCFDRKDDALRFKAETEGKLHRGTWLDPDRGRVTVGELAQDWLNIKTQIRKPSTAAAYREVYRALIAPRWAEVPVAAVTYSDVERWVGTLIARDLSPSRVHHAHLVLRNVLKTAVKDRRIEANPADGVDLPSLPMRGEHLYLTPAQLQALADAIGPHYRGVVLVMGMCGLRWGEVAGLRVGDVDLPRRRLHVRRNLTEVQGALVETSPKTHQQRWVPMPPQVLAAVEPLVDRPTTARLFTTINGFDLRVGNFRRNAFNKAAASIGLPGLKPHSLRHAAVSTAVQAGGKVKDVQRMVGHKRASMTLDVYSDVFEEGLDDLAQRIGRLAEEGST